MKRTTKFLLFTLMITVYVYFGISNVTGQGIELPKLRTPVDETATAGAVFTPPGILGDSLILRTVTASSNGMLPEVIVTTETIDEIEREITYKEKPGIHDMAFAFAQADLKWQGITNAGGGTNDYSAVATSYYMMAKSLFGTGKWIDENPTAILQ